MNINRNNCEAWFLDYYEGNLSEGQVRELFAFLNLQPDLRESFESFQDVSFDADHVSFDFKNELKKESPVSNANSRMDELMIASVEGLISKEEQKELDQLLGTNTEKAKEFELYKLTILSADTVEFEHKSELKKSVEISTENFDSFAVQYGEGTLLGIDLIAFEKFISIHPEFQAELVLFNQAKLEIDSSIVFENKKSLYKTSLVNESNFETFAARYVDADLNESESRELLAFVAANPAYQNELDLFKQTRLHADHTIAFEDKTQLRRSTVLVHDGNAEEMILASMEKQLNASEEKALAQYLSANPQQEHLVVVYAQTRVQPDMQIVFEEKAALKQKERGAFWLMSPIRFAAAAAIALIIGIAIFFSQNTVESGLGETLASFHFNGKTKQRLQPSTDQQPETFVADQQSRIPKNALPNALPSRLPRETMASTLTAKNSLHISSRVYENEIRKSDPPAFINSPTVLSSPDGESISALQFGLRWANNKIKPTDSYDQLDPEDAKAMRKEEENKNVTGYDLTKSALNRIGIATGSRLGLSKDNTGTIFSIGKYDFRVGKAK
jgi:anti-sigma factor RsiW